MAEPRKVQFVTLSAFAAGSATESRKQRRLEEDDEEDEEEAEDDVNFDEEDSGEEEVDDDGAATAAAATAGAGGVVVGNNGRLDLRDNKAEGKKITMRLNLSLCEPSDHASAEFNYGELIKNIQKRNNPPIQKNPPIQNPPVQNPGLNSSDPFNDDERERLQLEALAKKFEDKYSNTAGKKKKDRMQDLIDIGFGYDETDPFIDNSEAYDELVPASLTTKLGGFYINTGTLQFRPASDTEGEEGAKIVIDDDDDDDEKVIKRRKKKEVNSLEEKKPRKIRVPKQGGLPLNLHRPEKKKRKKLMKDSLCLAAMLRRFTREKEEMRKRNPNALQTGLPNNPHSVASTNLLLASNSSHLLLGNVANSDNVSLADLTSDPAMVSLLGSASEKELQDLLGDLDFSLLDSAPQHVMATARENGLLGVGVPANKAAGGGQARGLGASSGHFSPPPLPDGVPAPLIKRIEDLRTASRQFDQEGRKKFFTLDMNNILLDIELQVQEQPQEVRSGIYSHLEAFVPCNKEALLKRLKKLSINIQDDRLRTPLLKLKLAVCSVMPEQIQRYNMDCIAKAAKQQSEEGEKNGSEEEDEEKPGKRVMGPRKKFVWDDKLRSLLCSLVRVKLSCYELENQCSLTVEEYLKAFMENEVKPLWPKGWMQARILLKESRVVHGHLTGNLVKRRMVPGPKAKAKDGLWIQRPLLSMATTTAMGTSMPHLPAGQRPSSSPSEPICLSDSLDEDLTAPSLDSISHALALFGGSSKGMGHSDSPLSPPPLQMPTSSPPSVTPHYSSTTQLSASVTSSAQHSLSKTETVPLAGMPTTTPPSAISTSSSSSSSTTPSTSASMARLQMAGSSSSLASRALDVTYGLIKGSSAASQNQRHVTMVTPTHRPGSAMGGSSNKLHPLPSPSPPKQRPPPTSSPLLPPHQKGFGSSPGVVASNPHGLAKNSAKASSVSSNGGAMSCSIPTSSSSSRSNSNNSHQCLRTFSPVVAFSTSHSPQGKSHPLPGQQQTQHHLHQANFITPMQATLTKSSHSSNASPIIKLTPRPPAPTPPPSSSSSSPSPSSSPSNSLSHQYSAKSPGFRPPFSGGQGKQSQGNYGFAGGQKAQSVAGSSSVNNGSNSSNHGNMGVVVSCSSRQELTPSPSSLVSANHGQRQRSAGGAGQGSKAGGGRVSSGALSTPSATSHLAQVSSAGSALLGSSAALPLSFGMLGGLVPVTLPFQFPSLLNFTAPGAPGAGSMGTVASANSGYSLSPNELMDLYKSLQSGAQAALPPHLQLAFSDANQSQGGDMKRKSH